MEKATFIKPEDLANLVTNEDGTVQIPDNIEIYIKPTKEEEIIELEERISIMETQEPDDEELLMYAKSTHPYYFELEEIDNLKKELKELKQ